MTDTQLAKMDIHPDKHKLRPNQYWSNSMLTHMNIPRHMTIQDLMENIYERGQEIGKEEGMRKRSKQIMYLLGNEDLD